MNSMLKIAKAAGFEAVTPFSPEILIPRQDVRDMCGQGRCGIYEKNWGCPPACGSLAECAEKMAGYDAGILVQTVGQLSKTIDTRGYAAAEKLHLKRFYALCEEAKRLDRDALCLGAGGCRICAEGCAWPEPCRFPDKALSSMEAYGLFVTQVCRDCGAEYYHGPKTVTYSSCILFHTNYSNPEQEEVNDHETCL